jgi:hypothetical protein
MGSLGAIKADIMPGALSVRPTISRITSALEPMSTMIAAKNANDEAIEYVPKPAVPSERVRNDMKGMVIRFTMTAQPTRIAIVR